MSIQKKIILLSLALILTLLLGIFGYHLIEKYNYLDSFYMTLITITTVGFQEIEPLSPAGKILTSVIIVCGVTIFTYSIGTLLKLIVEGEVAKLIGKSRRVKMISSSKGHYIICGYGRIGSLIASELKSNGFHFIIIDKDSTNNEEFKKNKYLFVTGDATDEDILNSANISKARGIITCVKDDSDNVYICLTARSINPDIFIMARGSDEKSKIKLKNAGANKVLLPYLIGGQRMAQAIIRPTVVDFLDIATMDRGLGLVMEEVYADDTPALIGKNLIESNIRKNYGAMIVSIKKTDGQMIFNPESSEIIERGDVLVLLAKKENLKKLSKLK